MMLTADHIDQLVTTAKQAGDATLVVYHDDNFETEIKADNSPVTAADLAANDVIVSALSDAFPDIFLVSEEIPLDANTILPSRFWLIDPLDGTKSFLKKTGEFTVNIGLIEHGRPVWGVVYVPVSGISYYVGADGNAYKQYSNEVPQCISARTPPEEGVTVVASQSHLDPETAAYIEAVPQVASWKSVGSSLKFCSLADGTADIYPRFGPTMEWDTAAAHAVLNAAGGSVTQPDGSPFTYSHMQQDRPLLNGPFIARGSNRIGLE